MRKICSITTIPNSMNNFMLPEAIALAEDGWESVVISSFRTQDTVIIPNHIKYYSVPMERSYDIKVAVKSIAILYKIFRQEKFDIVQYGTTHAALFGSIASFIARVPNRLFLQWGPTGYNDFKGIRKYLTKSVEILIGCLSTTIRTVSHKNLSISVKEGLYPASKAKVVGEGGTIGVNLEDYPLHKRNLYSHKIRQKYGLSDNDFIFGFTGRFTKPKGIIELLNAFKTVSSKIPVKLMIIGPDETHMDLPVIQWARQNPSIIFTGRVEHNKIAQYLAALDVLVHPSYREGFGMVLQEAMAMGTPIITTNIPGPSEVIEDGISGKLVPVRDENALINAMYSAINSPDEYQNYSRNGRIRVEKYFDRKLRLKLLVKDKNEIINPNQISDN